MSKLMCKCGGDIAETAFQYVCVKCHAPFGGTNLSRDWNKIGKVDRNLVAQGDVDLIVRDTLQLLKKYGEFDETQFEPVYDEFQQSRSLVGNLEAAISQDIPLSYCEPCKELIYSDVSGSGSFTSGRFMHDFKKHGRSIFWERPSEYKKATKSIGFHPPYMTLIEKVMMMSKPNSFKEEFPKLAKFIKKSKLDV